MQHLQRIQACIVVLAAIAVAEERLEAAVIDIFAGPPQIAERSTPGRFPVAAPPVMLSGSLFDQRSLEVRYGVQRLQVTDEELVYEALDGPPGYTGNLRGYPRITYSSAEGIDLLGDGATAFRIYFGTFLVQYPHLLDLQLSSDGMQQSVGMAGLLPSTSEPTYIDIPFDRFDAIDLSAVTELQFYGGRLPVGSTFTITGIHTVPEPTPAIPLIVGSFAAFATRSRIGGSTKANKSE